MTINCPTTANIPALGRLWKQAFHDPDSFIDAFFQKGFSPQRCRCLFQDGQLAAALYWFDCAFGEKTLAYLYAVATDEAYRHQGLCHTLMADTLDYLKNRGYAGAILVPAGEDLRQLYCHMGFQDFAGIREFTCLAGTQSIPLQQLTAEEYAARRKCFLPENSVLQEGAALEFLNTYTQFYAGENVLFSLFRDEETAFVAELLGDAEKAPSILCALGLSHGRFRVPGKDPFAMYYPLTDDFSLPGYFGHALD